MIVACADEAAPVQVEAHVTRALEGAPSGHETTRTKPMSAGPPSSKAGSDVHDRAPAPSSEQAPGAVVAGHVTTQTESAGPLISRAGMAVDDRAPALSSEQASGAAVVGNSEAPPRRGPHLLRLSIDEASVKIDERWTLRRNGSRLQSIQYDVACALLTSIMFQTAAWHSLSNWGKVCSHMSSANIL